MIVPNQFPTLSSLKKVAIIGESPGEDEEKQGRPFIGKSGNFLAALLSRAGLSRDMCFFGNVSQHRPLNNKIETFQWHGLEIQHGLEELRKDIEKFKPNIVVLLGNTALKAAKDPVTMHPLTPNGFRFKGSQWRGSLFKCTEQESPFYGYKCLASYHPAYALRDYDVTPLLQFDLRKAVREAAFPELNLPKRNLITGLSQESQQTLLRAIRAKKGMVALDIEGGIDTMSCISFATSPSEAFIIPINQGTTIETWKELAWTLEDPEVPKVLQNCLYDRFVLHYSYGIRVQGIIHDTMVKHWELYSELEKSLAVQASIYTDEPYWKYQRKEACQGK